MTETTIHWQQEIAAHYNENPEEVIETINDLLQQEPGEVLRQVTTELTLCLRAIGNLVQKIDNETESHIKTSTLFKTVDAGQEKQIDVNGFKQMLNDHVVESRQIVDLLAIYAMALSHEQSANNTP